MEELKEYNEKRAILIENMKTKPFTEVEKELKDIWKSIPVTIDLEDYELHQIAKDNFKGDPDYEAFMKRNTVTYKIDVGGVPPVDAKKYVKQVQEKFKRPRIKKSNF